MYASLFTLNIVCFYCIVPVYSLYHNYNEFQVYNNDAYEYGNQGVEEKYEENDVIHDNAYTDFALPKDTNYGEFGVPTEQTDNLMARQPLPNYHIPKDYNNYGEFGRPKEQSDNLVASQPLPNYQENIRNFEKSGVVLVEYTSSEDEYNILGKPYIFDSNNILSDQVSAKDNAIQHKSPRDASLFWNPNSDPPQHSGHSEFWDENDPDANKPEIAELLSSLAIVEDDDDDAADVKAMNDGTFNLSEDQIQASRSKGCSRDTVVTGVSVSAQGKASVKCSVPLCLTNKRTSFTPQDCQVFVERTCPDQSWVADLFAVAESSFDPNLLLPLCCDYPYSKLAYVLRTVTLTPRESLNLGEIKDLNTGATTFDLVSRITESHIGDIPEYAVTISRIDCSTKPIQPRTIDSSLYNFNPQFNDSSLYSFNPAQFNEVEEIVHYHPQSIPIPPPTYPVSQFRAKLQRQRARPQPRVTALKRLNLKPIVDARKSRKCCKPNCCEQKCCNQGKSMFPRCFTGESIVTTPSGPKNMSQLKIGDIVLASVYDELAWEPVRMFIHRVPLETATFIQLNTESGNTISLTGNHLIYNVWCHEHLNKTQWRLSYAKDVSVGSCLIHTGNSTHTSDVHLTRVMSVSYIESQGIYAPLTSNGAIVVDSILASCHSTLSNTSVMAALFNFVQYFEALFNLSLWNDNTEIVQLPNISKFLISFAKNIIPIDSTHF